MSQESNRGGQTRSSRNHYSTRNQTGSEGSCQRTLVIELAPVSSDIKDSRHGLECLRDMKRYITPGVNEGRQTGL
ncbi:hypothetical protein PISMIDRAFT_678323 [Pisolithus microcarpus 441]|uniref:Uncharacterized protein n=1 Tax=Pisolithus microcarpus 441 TaxID=765257 RepID=A0A0C9ZQ88_9AGAM|nr:hypothetical protein PISMIDRAFT_678323 [Pisolithus microcarpus 441]